MGSEASFYNFPAHVHDLLTDLLSESHVIYTRVYPRYKTHGELQAAVNDFSSWLAPHEVDDLDIILVGHSLGGILSAEVALLPDSTGKTTTGLKHRILGLVNFDVPFLGLHPRVIATGISGLFHKKDAPYGTEFNEEDYLGLDPAYIASPYFDPPFENDKHLIKRDRFDSVMHFLCKNVHHLSRAVFDRLLSSYKFAGHLNNYSQLRQRYRKLMELEAAERGNRLDRIRFINYYTTSTGFTTKRKKKKSTKQTRAAVYSLQSPRIGLTRAVSENGSRDQKGSSVEDYSSLSAFGKLRSVGSDSALVGDCDEADKKHRAAGFTDSGLTRPTELAKSNSLSGMSISSSIMPTEMTKKIKPSVAGVRRKFRKFVLMPSHHWRHGDNSLWMPVQMENMDEVVAHQSMFIPHGNIYDELVGDTVTRIESWAQDNLSERAL
ncbi:hypothetical protein N7522_002016 [Penicillium canescens]|uniref:AB hydrolase-1 domain-containing protein n=2 Tax=Penicillium canescens TaxID=5083 RepID=A0AAD6I676_PENCN|nr:hypothetical protein N7522_002016 [Penicillium canescens]KAJ6034158.1 hypothetical protein N7460_009975 [Penicillium canescens]KAJ6174722.1 hypothetical protein N7485_005166 [Penicillium canescens]